MTDDLIARQSFAARNAALEHYKKSALVNIGPPPPPTVGEQLHKGERPMSAKDYKLEVPIMADDVAKLGLDVAPSLGIA